MSPVDSRGAPRIKAGIYFIIIIIISDFFFFFKEPGDMEGSSRTPVRRSEPSAAAVPVRAHAPDDLILAG